MYYILTQRETVSIQNDRKISSRLLRERNQLKKHSSISIWISKWKQRRQMSNDTRNKQTNTELRLSSPA